MAGRRDYYDVLGVRRNAGQDDIKRAYRRLARQYHPDVNKGADAEASFKEINEAYEVLSDREKRASYDRFGHAGVSGDFTGGFSDFGFGDIFEEFFGGFGRRTSAARRAPQRGADLRYDLRLTFEEAVFGSDQELEIPRWETCQTCRGSGAEPGTTPMRCPQCNGTGEVRHVQQSLFGSFVNVTSCNRCDGEGKVVTTPCHECRGRKQVQRTRNISVQIPAGVDDGTQIRLSGQGEAGIRGGPPGNLYVVLSVKPHRFFRRQNSTILLEMPINIAQAALGDEVTVPTLDGDEKLVIPAGTQSGETFRLRGKGVPYVRRTGRGDQLVTVYVVTPTDLTEEQKDLLGRLGETLGTAPIPQAGKGFLDQLKDVFGI